MKYVFFSDIHGNYYALEKFLVELELIGPDKCFFLGDIFGYYYDQNAIINALRNRQDLICLLGNHDKYFLDILENKICPDTLISKYGNSYKDIVSKISLNNIEFVKNLPQELEIRSEGLKIGLFHGTPDNPLNGRLYPDTIIQDPEVYKKYDYVILGHTHHKHVRKLGTTTIINPGSLGQQRDGKGCSYVILILPEGIVEYRQINFDIDKLVFDIHKNDGYNDNLISVLYRKSE